MRTIAIATVCITVALAGCFNPFAPSGGGSPGGSNGTGSNGNNGTTEAVNSVTWTTIAANGTPGESLQVCWHVDGTGTIPHTAVHTDTTSRNGQGYAAYTGATYYPNDASSAIAEVLPGTFCTHVILPTFAASAGVGKLFLVAHAMTDAGASTYSVEKSISVAPAIQNTATAITLQDPPATAVSNMSIHVCWQVQGAGTIPSTALLWDTTSHSGTSVPSSAYPNKVFPNNAGSASASGYTIPGTFCGNFTGPSAAAVYVRAVATNPGTKPEVLAAESKIALQGMIASLDFNGTVLAAATPNSNDTICWKVLGAGMISATGLLTDDNASHAAANATPTAYKGKTYYPANATQSAPEMLPGHFCTNVFIPLGIPPVTVYVRVWAVDYRGLPGQLSPDEKSVVG
ncbi:MAG: hypothetical protein ACYDDF_14280 [Thermoplasmatota archaeon]